MKSELVVILQDLNERVYSVKIVLVEIVYRDTTFLVVAHKFDFGGEDAFHIADKFFKFQRQRLVRSRSRRNCFSCEIQSYAAFKVTDGESFPSLTSSVTSSGSCKSLKVLVTYGRDLPIRTATSSCVRP